MSIAYRMLLIVLVAGCLSGCMTAQKQCMVAAEYCRPQGLYRISDVEEKVVVLTIDDGPSQRTGEILDKLKQHNATATFFVHTDHIEQHPEGAALLKRMIDEGHQVGHHMPEDTPSHKLDAKQFATAFKKSHKALCRLGVRPKLFRPAGGHYKEGTMQPVLEEHGYDEQYLLASYLPWDVTLPFPKTYANNLVDGAFPGAIVVLHDGENKGHERLDRTMTTLEQLLEGLDEKEYRVCSVRDAKQVR